MRISGNLKIRTELQLEFGNLYVSFFLELAHFYQINNTFLQGEMLYQRVLCSSSFKHLYEWAIAFNMCTPPIEDSGNPQGAGNFEAGNPQGASDFEAGNLQVPAIFRLEIRRCP